MREVKTFLSGLLIAGFLAAGPLTFGFLGAGPAGAGGAVSVDSLPPVVVETFPRAGDTQVDPATAEIRVTFSKDMMTEEMWSWVIQTKESFPEVVGEVRFLDDGRTCVAPVKLQPGRQYAIWFNAPDYSYNAFRDRNNTPAVPYLLVFETSD